MKRLQDNRIETLRKYLQAAKVDPELFPEILDHLSCEAEERLWDGKSFEQAYNGIVEVADPKTLLFLSAETKHLLAMEKSLNDIVFEGRNKLYGAYALRKGYKQTMQRAVLLGVTIFLLMIMLPDLYARLVPERKAKDIAYIVEVRPIDIRPQKETPKIPEPEAVQPVEKVVRNKSLIVMPDHNVEEDYSPPTTDDMLDANPGQSTNQGTGGITLVEEPVAKAEAAPIAEPRPEADVILDFAEEAPQYIGGMEGMTAFLQKNLRYPSQASRQNVQGRVFIQFTVGSDGKIENVKSIKGIGFGCDEEAERVVKMMPSWKPGRQSGKAVRVRYTLPIAFQLD
jgi:periplasmic protein TonB